MTLPNPLQINLGTGRIKIGYFSDDEGYGLVFIDSGTEHKVGSIPPDSIGEHMPEKDEVYIHCANRDSAFVLMEQVCRIVAAFANKYEQENTGGEQ